MIRRRTACAVIGASLVAPALRAATPYPTRPVKIVLPFPPGGVADVLARLLAEAMTTAFGQPFSVDNRPGANSIIGADYAAKAAADGYTLLFTGDFTLSVNQHLFAKLPYDPLRDFVPISLVADVPLMLATQASVPVQTVQEFIAYAKARPDTLVYGSSGIGSFQHLTTEAFAQEAGLKLRHVPYKGGSLSTNALLGGDLQLLFGGVPTLMPHAKAGKIRALAVTSPQRSAPAPDVPTLAESGMPGFDVRSSLGLLAPRNTPAEVVARLHNATLDALKTPAVREVLAINGFAAVGGGTEEFRAYIARDTERWGKLVSRLGIRLEAQ